MGIPKASELLSHIKPRVLSPRYLELVRLLRGTPSEHARYWRLLVKGMPRVGYAPPVRVGGFFRHYIVVAETLDDALSLASAIEPERDWAHLDLDQHEEKGPAGSQLTGVVEASGPVWYGGDI
jgi:hypothetical protein